LEFVTFIAYFVL